MRRLLAALAGALQFLTGAQRRTDYTIGLGAMSEQWLAQVRNSHPS